MTRVTAACLTLAAAAFGSARFGARCAKPAMYRSAAPIRRIQARAMPRSSRVAVNSAASGEGLQAYFDSFSSQVFGNPQAKSLQEYLDSLDSAGVTLSATKPRKAALPLPSVTCLSKIADQFEGAVQDTILNQIVIDVFGSKGFTTANTLFGTSTCPDEINRFNEMQDAVWNQRMPLGGLAGLPFAGKTGFAAYASHVPDGGKLLVLSGSHVGVSNNGEVGKVSRRGQGADSGACGACLAAYAAVADGWKKEKPDGELIGDSQLVAVKQAVSDAFSKIKASKKEVNTAVASAVSDRIWEEMQKVVPDDLPYPVGLINGIQINTGVGEADFYQIRSAMWRAGPGKPWEDLMPAIKDQMATYTSMKIGRGSITIG